MKKRAYRATLVKTVQLNDLLTSLPAGPVTIGLDIAKHEVLAVLRDSQGQSQRPWKFKQPSEIRLFTTLLGQLAPTHAVQVALESTGTYGDALRQALHDAQLPVCRVSAKATHDYAEIFDGVPSQHDGKDAAIVAELAALGRAQPWPSEVRSADEDAWHQEVAWLDAQQRILQVWLGRLEALLARHWPEVSELLALDSVTLLRTLITYGGPQALTQDPQAREQLARWGKQTLKPDKLSAVLESARTTVGVRLTAATQSLLQRSATAAYQARQAVRSVKTTLTQRAKRHPILRRMAQAVGPATACVLWSALGDPRNYPCAAAYRKALGLNLKERSSGQYVGQLKISKRGSPLARRWLFFAAMRLLQREPVRSWYLRKKGRDQQRGSKGVVAVMRKLALAVHVVAQDEAESFAASRLFPGRSLRRSRVVASGKGAV